MQPTIGRLALQHEQTHFDLSEVHAQKMRRALSELKDPCALTSVQRQAVVAPFGAEDARVQRQYDVETSNGSNLARQGDWDREVSKQLALLARYKTP